MKLLQYNTGCIGFGYYIHFKGQRRNIRFWWVEYIRPEEQFYMSFQFVIKYIFTLSNQFVFIFAVVSKSLSIWSFTCRSTEALFLFTRFAMLNFVRRD